MYQHPITIRTPPESCSIVERVPVLLQPFQYLCTRLKIQSLGRTLQFLRRAPEISKVDALVFKADTFSKAETPCRHRSHFFSDFLHEFEKSSCIEQGESCIDPYFGGVVGS